MKILHVIPSLSGLYGGPAQAVWDLCQELHILGVETAVATTGIGADRVPGKYAEFPIYSFVRQFSSLLPSDFSFSCGLKNWLKEHVIEYDLLHIHSLFTYPASIACFYARKYRIPYILMPEGMLGSVCLRRSRFKKKVYILFFERNNLKNAAVIHFTSEEEMLAAKDFLSTLGVADNKYALVPIGLSFDKFKGVESLKGSFRSRYSEIGERKIILFLSRLHPIKGLDLLIPALKILSRKRDDFIFVLAGSGDKNYEKVIRDNLTNAGLNKISVVTGFLEGEAKFAALSDSDIFVLPSYHESFGMAVVEAMAAGLPVVISNQVGICKLIEDCQAGIITELNTQAIASALEGLLLNDSLRVQMGSRGKMLVVDNFDVEEVGKKMCQIYSGLIHSKVQ